MPLCEFIFMFYTICLKLTLMSVGKICYHKCISSFHSRVPLLTSETFTYERGANQIFQQCGHVIAPAEFQDAEVPLKFFRVFILFGFLKQRQLFDSLFTFHHSKPSLKRCKKKLLPEDLILIFKSRSLLCYKTSFLQECLLILKPLLTG